MRKLVLCVAILTTPRGFAAQDIKRLSPVPGPSQIPVECRIVSVFKDSPAVQAGIEVGDVIQAVNGQRPLDASGFPDLVASAPEQSEFEVQKSTGTVQTLKVHLNSARPRLGAVCDLSGWSKPGVTAAGNESVTAFSGPYALTVSGIIDKGLVFVRVRVANDSDQPLEVGPSLFSATDGGKASLILLSPKDVMCRLYGDKGAHLLTLKKKKKDTLDAQGFNVQASSEPAADDRCDNAWTKGLLHGSQSDYAEANAKYVAEESLWPDTVQPGQAADGLLYFAEPSTLPLALSAEIAGHHFSAQLGMPVPSEREMTRADLRRLFEGMKKGTSVRLTLRKGKVFVGRFASFDTIEERAWFNSPSGGMLNSTSYSLEAIRDAVVLEQVPSKHSSEKSRLK